jgi:hypothetical protein
LNERKEITDQLFEIIRRAELAIFILGQHTPNKPKIIYAKKLKIELAGSANSTKDLRFEPDKKDQISSCNKKLMKSLQTVNFINSQKHGILLKKSDKWLSKSWNEKYCVITNVGLLYYNDPSKRPRNLFPIIDTSIETFKENAFNRKYVF